MAERIPQSATLRVPLQAYLSSDHIAPAPGVTIAITISKNGAAYANPSAGATNATEIGTGSYYVDLSVTDTGTLGPLFVKGTSATIDNVIAIYNVVNNQTGGFDASTVPLSALIGKPTTQGGALKYLVQERLNVMAANKTTGVNSLYEDDGVTIKTSQTFTDTSTTASRTAA